MHENYESMLFWSHLNLESLSNCNFFNEIFFSYFICNFGKKIDIKTKKNKRNYINFVLCHQIIRMVCFCVKTEKSTILLHFMEVLYQKDWKVAKNWKTCLLFYGCHGNRDDVIMLIMTSNDLQYDSRKSHQIWSKTDKNSRGGEQIYGGGAQCAPPWAL